MKTAKISAGCYLFVQKTQNRIKSPSNNLQGGRTNGSFKPARVHEAQETHPSSRRQKQSKAFHGYLALRYGLLSDIIWRHNFHELWFCKILINHLEDGLKMLMTNHWNWKEKIRHGNSYMICHGKEPLRERDENKRRSYYTTTSSRHVMQSKQ